MADYATHYWDEAKNCWETAWCRNEDIAKATAAKLIKAGTAKAVFISIELFRAYADDVVFEDID